MSLNPTLSKRCFHKINMARLDRINSLLQTELAGVLNKELGLANVLVTVVAVDTSPDLKQAKVWVSVLPDKIAGSALRELKAKTPQIISLIKPRIKLRRFPHLIWLFDASEREADKIEKIIAKSL